MSVDWKKIMDSKLVRMAATHLATAAMEYGTRLALHLTGKAVSNFISKLGDNDSKFAEKLQGLLGQLNEVNNAATDPIMKMPPKNENHRAMGRRAKTGFAPT